VENPSSSKRVAAVGCDDDRDPVCDGVRMDGKWEHHPVHEGKYQSGSVGACMSLVQGPHLHLVLMIARLL
jgi:hypothetical protein